MYMNPAVRRKLFLFLAGLMPVVGVMAQDDSVTTRFRLRDFSFVKAVNPWLTSDNAAGLTRFNQRNFATAEVNYEFLKGGLVNYDQSPRVISLGADAEAFHRLGRRFALYGKISYNSYSGHAMAGSAFIDTERLPFNLVEDSLTNLGKKYKDTYHLIGGVGVDVWKGLSIGAKLDYTAANMAKYKDLRHKTKLMNMVFTLGATYRTGIFTLGADYFYRRNTQTITFSTYGKTEKDYYTLVDYGIFTGRPEYFGLDGFTDKSREMPLLNDYQGGGVQLGIAITPRLYFYNAFRAAHRDGYYGRKSPYTITFTNHTGDTYRYDANLSLRLPASRHVLRFTLDAEDMENYMTTRQNLTNDLGATYYEYFTPVKSANKLWVNTNVDYTAWFGPNLNTSVTAGVNLMHRKQTVYYYPYYRRQNIRSNEYYLQGQYNHFLRKGFLTFLVRGSYAYGQGEPYEQELYEAAPQMSTTVTPPEMTDYLYREYQYLTANQYAVKGSVTYTFPFLKRQPDLLLYVRGDVDHRKANGLPQNVTDADGNLTIGNCLTGRDRLQLRLAVGCHF